MSLLVIALVFGGILWMTGLTSALPGRKRIKVVGLAIGLLLLGAATGFELGRIQASYERDIERNAGEKHEEPSDEGTTPILVRDVDDPALPLTDRERTTLRDADMTRVAMPFGVLLAADRRMPAAYVEQSAAVLAEMLDQDRDGRADDPTLVDLLSDRATAWLAMPVDEDDWERRQLPRLERALGYDIVIPAWWLEPVSDGPDDHGRAVIVEEIHHFITQFGLSRLHPEIFGVDDWTSVIARETQRARCDFWQHPENDCPGRPAVFPGECADPNCDVVEFYHQVVVTRAGMEPGWRGIGFPETRDELEAALGAEIKAAIDDPRFHQLRRPLRFGYPADVAAGRGGVDDE